MSQRLRPQRSTATTAARLAAQLSSTPLPVAQTQRLLVAVLRRPLNDLRPLRLWGCQGAQAEHDLPSCTMHVVLPAQPCLTFSSSLPCCAPTLPHLLQDRASSFCAPAPAREAAIGPAGSPASHPGWRARRTSARKRTRSARRRRSGGGAPPTTAPPTTAGMSAASGARREAVAPSSSGAAPADLGPSIPARGGGGDAGGGVLLSR